MTRKAASQPRRRPKPAAHKHPPSATKWSRAVMQKSDALDLREGTFKLKSPRAIATSLKRSAEASQRRKSSPFRSAMSMLNFEINRAGRNLTQERIRVLNAAKSELRKVFGRPP